MLQCRGVTAERSAICRSPPTGGKQVVSGRKRPSSPCFPPADAHGARRFRLLFLMIRRDSALPSFTEDDEWRWLRSPRAQAAGPWHRAGRLRPKRLSGPAVPGRRSTTAGTSPRTRVSTTVICVYLRDLRFSPMGEWAALLCLRVFVPSCLRCLPLCVSLCPLCLCG